MEKTLFLCRNFLDAGANSVSLTQKIVTINLTVTKSEIG